MYSVFVYAHTKASQEAIFKIYAARLEDFVVALHIPERLKPDFSLDQESGSVEINMKKAGKITMGLSSLEIGGKEGKGVLITVDAKENSGIDSLVQVADRVALLVDNELYEHYPRCKVKVATRNF